MWPSPRARTGRYVPSPRGDCGSPPQSVLLANIQNNPSKLVNKTTRLGSEKNERRERRTQRLYPLMMPRSPHGNQTSDIRSRYQIRSISDQTSRLIDGPGHPPWNIQISDQRSRLIDTLYSTVAPPQLWRGGVTDSSSHICAGVNQSGCLIKTLISTRLRVKTCPSLGIERGFYFSDQVSSWGPNPAAILPKASMLTQTVPSSLNGI